MQRNYFSQHKDIYFGGAGIKSNIDYVNSEINLLLESGILYFNDYLYNKEIKRFKKAIKDFYISCGNESKSVSGLSSEHLIFNFSPQSVDYQQKIKRIHELFGPEIKIILILRNQMSLIKSIYKEFLRMGYIYTYSEFINWIYKFQDRNFYYELMYGEVIDYICNYFPKENLFIDWFENYKNSDYVDLHKLFTRISSFLGVSDQEFDISNHNPSISDGQISSQIIANKEYRHDYGLTHLEGLEDHRRRIYFNEYLRLGYTEEELFSNIIIKRKALSSRKNSDDCDSYYLGNPQRKQLELMKQEFEKSNILLKRGIHAN